jgi:3-hydroxyisobutyrate dehydrogenase
MLRLQTQRKSESISNSKFVLINSLLSVKKEIMVAFIGTGLLGSGFVEAMLNRGEPVQVWNRSFEKTKPLESKGAKAFASIADAVKGCERIHICLTDDNVVDEVLEKAWPGFKPGAIIVDHSTTSVQGAKNRALHWSTKGFHYMHAPVFMGPANALNSNGTMMVSGDQEIIRLLEPSLRKMTGKLWNLGDDPGKAAAIKLLGNLFHICFTGAFADVMTMAHSLNIATSELGPLFEILNPGGIAQARIKKIESNTFDKASWELRMARKDARLMTEQADLAGKTLTVIPAVAKRMDAFIEKGQGKNDWTVITKDN